MKTDYFSKEMIKEVMEALKTYDGFFVSEAHLQCEFIIKSAGMYPDFYYYPEFIASSSTNNEKMENKRFDLIIQSTTSGDKVLIEFKYVKEAFNGNIHNIPITLKSDGAIDLRRYDCWNGISRIEEIIDNNTIGIKHGYFIVITNVQRFWEEHKRETKDIEFSMKEGKHTKGRREWKNNPAPGDIKGREKSITTQNDYFFEYEIFKDHKSKNGLFKSLIVNIEKPNNS